MARKFKFPVSQAAPEAQIQTHRPFADVYGGPYSERLRAVEVETLPGNHPASRWANAPDTFTRTFRTIATARRGLYVGMDGEGPVHTPEDTNLLILAPSRSPIGKTVSYVIPNLLVHHGPALSTSTKADVLRATALCRSALGRIWHFAPDGEPVVEGALALRWSMVHAIATTAPDRRWDLALDMSGLAVDAALSEDSGQNAGHFRDLARNLLAAVLFTAALFGRDMAWALTMLAARKASVPDSARASVEVVTYVETWNTDKDPAEQAEVRLLEVPGILEALGYKLASQALKMALAPETRERESIFSTTSRTIRAYLRDSALATAVDCNFDMAEFVRGRAAFWNDSLALRDPTIDTKKNGDRYQGKYDTVYVTAERQAEIAPIIVAFITHARQAANELLREAERKERRNLPARLLLALDEMGTMAPLGDLPEMLAKGRSGSIIIGVLQDMTQARDIWGAKGMGLLTLFQNLVVLRGIRDKDTLDLIEKISGHYYEVIEERQSGTSRQNGWSQGSSSGSSEGISTRHERIPRIDVNLIVHGRPDQPDAGLFFGHGAFEIRWVQGTPYYRSDPWPQALLKHAAWLLATTPQSWRVRLPFPALADLQSLRRSEYPLYDQLYYALREMWAEAQPFCDSMPEDDTKVTVSM